MLLNAEMFVDCRAHGKGGSQVEARTAAIEDNCWTDFWAAGSKSARVCSQLAKAEGGMGWPHLRVNEP